MKGFLLLVGAMICAIGVGVGVVAAVGGLAAAPPRVSDLTSLPAPFTQVHWTHLAYSGLGCHSLGVGVVLERVAEVPVSGRDEPLALAEVSCNLNHVYANLYVFEASSNRLSPRFLQRLTPAGNPSIGEGISLSTASNDVTLVAAAGFRALCCPTTEATYRWVWAHNRFTELRPAPILTAVMPNLVGSTLEQSFNLTSRAQIPSSYSVNTPALLNDPNAKVKSQSPKPGAVLRSPFPEFIQVW